jgi:two-component system, LytTR family, response regulator
MNCIIVDDEKSSVALLKNLCTRRGLTVLDSFTDPTEALPAIQAIKPDFVLLDIQMEQMNGLDVAEQLNNTTKIIFCTAYEKFAVKSYEFEAVDYLLKPIAYSRFCIAINRLENLLSLTPKKIVQNIDNDYIFCKLVNSKSIAKIDVNSIDYFLSERNTVHIYTNSGRRTVYSTLNEMEDRLPASEFIRIHKSYIIPTRRIVQFNVHSVIVNCTGTEVLQITVGDKYKENIAAYMHSVNLSNI